MWCDAEIDAKSSSQVNAAAIAVPIVVIFILIIIIAALAIVLGILYLRYKKRYNHHYVTACRHVHIFVLQDYVTSIAVKYY